MSYVGCLLPLQDPPAARSVVLLQFIDGVEVTHVGTAVVSTAHLAGEGALVRRLWCRRLGLSVSSFAGAFKQPHAGFVGRYRRRTVLSLMAVWREAWVRRLVPAPGLSVSSFAGAFEQFGSRSTLHALELKWVGVCGGKPGPVGNRACGSRLLEATWLGRQLGVGRCRLSGAQGGAQRCAQGSAQGGAQGSTRSGAQAGV